MGLAPSIHQLSESLYWHYQAYKAGAITNRRFSYQEFRDTLFSLTNNDIFRVTELGLSEEGRELYLVKAGGGPIKIFLWSQMHGDEPTATQSLFDCFLFLAGDDHLNYLREEMLKSLTLYFLPMVNPDGAELFQRENSAGIDLNRDAVNLQTKEATILFNTFRKIKPDYGFNLHDQDSRYSLGEMNRLATLSFLAPPFDKERSLNPNRELAMKLISGMGEVLEKFIPGHIGKYSDEYEPTAFGDTFQSLGTATVLIESGAWKNDVEKQFVRQLNTIAILSAFGMIANGSVHTFPIEDYERLPFNDKNLFDLVLRNVRYERRGKKFTTDIAINRYDTFVNTLAVLIKLSKIEEMGGISKCTGIEELDCSDLEIKPPKRWSKSVRSVKDVEALNVPALLNKGISLIPYDTDFEFPENYLPELSFIPEGEDYPAEFLKTGKPAEFILEQDGSPVAIIHNGYYVRTSPDVEFTGNGFILK